MTSHKNRRAEPGVPLLLRILYFFLFGWWATGVWINVAWFLNATIIGLPLGVWMLNRVPQVLTLRPTRQVVVAYEPWRTGRDPHRGPAAAPLADPVALLCADRLVAQLAVGQRGVGHLGNDHRAAPGHLDVQPSASAHDADADLRRVARYLFLWLGSGQVRSSCDEPIPKESGGEKKMGIGDAIQSLFGGDEEPEDDYEAAFEQEAVLPDTAETTLGGGGCTRCCRGIPGRH